MDKYGIIYGIIKHKLIIVANHDDLRFEDNYLVITNEEVN